MPRCFPNGIGKRRVHRLYLQDACSYFETKDGDLFQNSCAVDAAAAFSSARMFLGHFNMYCIWPDKNRSRSGWRIFFESSVLSPKIPHSILVPLERPTLPFLFSSSCLLFLSFSFTPHVQLPVRVPARPAWLCSGRSCFAPKLPTAAAAAAFSTTASAARSAWSVWSSTSSTSSSTDSNTSSPYAATA